MVKKDSNACNIMKSYYESFASEYEECSGIMEQLFPPMSIYSSSSYPQKTDLCIIFTDRFGIEIHPDIEDKIKRLQKSWMYITVDKAKPVEILDMQEVLKGHVT